jgi:transglutaminase-like putative cysteine protease
MDDNGSVHQRHLGPYQPTDTFGSTGAVRYHVHHETRYDYAQVVSLSQQLLHLEPREFLYQQPLSHSITISPTPNERVDSKDYFGNHVQYLAITAVHDFLIVTAESEVLLRPRPGVELVAGSMPWKIAQTSLRETGNRGAHPLRSEANKYLFESAFVSFSPELAAYAEPSFANDATVLAAALDLTQRIHSDFKFDAEATDISTPIEELLKIKRGVCQDFAHLMIACLRTKGIACRYMSGYILTHPAPGKPRLVGADASHAWVSVYCPNSGWVDFDPTNRCMVNLEHLTIGWGRDFGDVSLVRGVMLGGGEQTLQVSVTVTPLT